MVNRPPASEARARGSRTIAASERSAAGTATWEAAQGPASAHNAGHIPRHPKCRTAARAATNGLPKGGGPACRRCRNQHCSRTDALVGTERPSRARATMSAHDLSAQRTCHKSRNCRPIPRPSGQTFGDEGRFFRVQGRPPAIDDGPVHQRGDRQKHQAGPDRCRKIGSKT